MYFFQDCSEYFISVNTGKQKTKNVNSAGKGVDLKRVLDKEIHQDGNFRIKMKLLLKEDLISSI